MLQNPSKYHPSPLSHFLALHNSAASHLHHNNHHHHQQNPHHYQEQFDQRNVLNSSGLDGSVTTSLDVGKSFTIAAILGLQKNVIENQNQKDYNSVMNLSLNNHLQKSNNCTGNNNGSNVSGGGGGGGGGGLNIGGNYDCDNLNSGRFLAAAAAATVTNGVSSVNTAHLRINHHFGHHSAVQAAAAAAAVAANATGSGPSALQSLQQLHQHHTQQAGLGFQPREKHKNDQNSAKKSSLKSKRVRTIFTPEQLERLEAEFERQQYMVGPERLYLAHTLQLTEAQVKVWFQNRRIKWRKHHLELTQQRLALIRQTQVQTGGEDPVNNPPPCIGGGPINKFHHSESDLSICNDSMDAESVNESEDA